MKFSNETCKHLNHYVYALAEPQNRHVFYIGKVKNNHVVDLRRRAFRYINV